MQTCPSSFKFILKHRQRGNPIIQLINYLNSHEEALNKKFIVFFKKFNSKYFSDFSFPVISSKQQTQNSIDLVTNFFENDLNLIAINVFYFQKNHQFFSNFSFNQITIFLYDLNIITDLITFPFQSFIFCLSEKEKRSLFQTEHVPPNLREALEFQQLPAFHFKYDPNIFFILDKLSISKNLNLPFPDARKNPNGFDYIPLIQIICPGYLSPEDCCPNCGAALLKTKYIENCCNNISNIREHMPPETAPQSIIDIVTNYSRTKWNFIRTLNRYSRPVLQKASYSNLEHTYSTLHIQGITYSIDSRFQFKDPVYIIASGDTCLSLQKPSSFSNEQFHDIQAIISILLRENSTLNQFVLDKLRQFSRDDFIAFVSDSTDRNTSIAAISTDNPFDKTSSLVTFYNDTTQISSNTKIEDYPTKIVPVESALYDQLLYPLLYWNGTGGIGKLYDDEPWKPKDMRYALRAICLQPPTSYCKQCSVLLDEYLCSGYGRDMQIKVNKAFQIQLSLINQKEALERCENQINKTKSNNEFGIKTFIPATLTGSPSYWNSVSKNGFYLSMILGAPTFFITMTENPHWHEIASLNTEKDIMMNSVLLARIFYQKKKSLISYIKKSKIFGEVKGYLWRDEYQKRGLPHCHILLWTDFDTSDVHELDKIITCRLPLEDPNLDNELQTNQLKELSKTFMTHTCTQRCGGIDGNCCYGFPKSPNQSTTIVNDRIEFARNIGDELIVAHSPKLLSLFRSHIDVEPVLSTSSIGYVLKYATKDSDSGDISFKNIKYCGKEVNENDNLHRYAATHIVSAPEAYNAICGLHRQEMSPTIELLPIHIEGERKMLIKRNESADEIARKFQNSMSKLERYFHRPFSPEFHDLKFCDYYSFYFVQNSSNGISDSGTPVFSVRKKEKRSYCAIKFVKITDHELFALRLLLQEIPARSFSEIKCGFQTFWESAKNLGLVENQNEFKTIMNEAIAIHRPPSDLRVLMLILYEQGADFEELMSIYQKELESDLRNKDITLNEIFCSMFASRNLTIPNYLLNDDNGETEEDIQFDLDCKEESQIMLNEGQQNFVDSLIAIVKNHKSTNIGPYLMFLQGRAGTGKTFTTNTLISLLRNEGYKVLVTGTTGIAASQYEGGQTVHSMFGLSIDQKIKDNEFHCNIGLDTKRAEELINADLIIIDEISMMTVKTATGVDYTLRYLVSSKYGFDYQNINYDLIPPFGNIPILFVGDLLQLPPVIPGSSASVAQRMITRCNWWNSIVLFGLFQPMRSLNINWTEYLINVGNGNNGDLRFWKDLKNRFGIKITRCFKEAVSFYLEGIDMKKQFPLAIQWISSTNKFVDSTNEYFFCKRSEYVNAGGKIFAYNEIKTELDKSDIANNLDDSEKFEFIKNMHHKDIPDSTMRFQVGEPVCVLRNLNTQKGIVKNKRCWVKTVMKYSVLVEFEDGSSYTIPRIKFSGVTNGIHFVRTQVPLKPIFAGTVHKSQGMTLTKGVIDLRSDLWEHGQLYVAFSRFKDPRNICILLPELTEDTKEDPASELIISPVAEESIVRLVQDIEEKCQKSCNIEPYVTNSFEFKKNFITDSSENDDQDDFAFVTSPLKNMDKFITDSSENDNADESFNEQTQVMKNDTSYEEKQEIFTKHGLINIGNTCYLNSILQILSHIGKFIEEIENFESFDEDTIQLSIFQQFFCKMNIATNYCQKDLNPEPILDILNIDYKLYFQEDVGEIFNRLINTMSLYCHDIIEKYFIIQGFQKVIHSDGSSTMQNIEMNMIHVGIPLISDVNEFDFSYLVDLELMDGRMPETDNPSQFQTIITRFTKLPKILCFYLQRVQISNDGIPYKTNIHISFDDSLQFPLTIASGNTEMRRYILFGVIIHIGKSPSSGHYTTFIQIADEWFYFDDTRIFRVTVDMVQNYSFGGSNKSASMLFYIEESMKDCIGITNFDAVSYLLERSSISILENNDLNNRIEFLSHMGFPEAIVRKAVVAYHHLSNTEIIQQLLYLKGSQKSRSQIVIKDKEKSKQQREEQIDEILQKIVMWKKKLEKLNVDLQNISDTGSYMQLKNEQVWAERNLNHYSKIFKKIEKGIM